MWNRVDAADITVQGDADGYSEGITVSDGDTVHVDTHAEASASADSVVLQWQFEGDVWTNNDKYYLLDHASADNIGSFAGLTVDGARNLSIDYTIEVTNAGSAGTPEFEVFDYGAGSYQSIAFPSSEGSKSGSMQIDGIDFIRVNEGNMANSYRWGLSVTVTVSKTPDASVDNKSVVTDGVHK